MNVLIKTKEMTVETTLQAFTYEGRFAMLLQLIEKVAGESRTIKESDLASDNPELLTDKIELQ